MFRAAGEGSAVGSRYVVHGGGVSRPTLASCMEYIGDMLATALILASKSCSISSRNVHVFYASKSSSSYSEESLASEAVESLSIISSPAPMTFLLL